MKKLFIAGLMAVAMLTWTGAGFAAPTIGPDSQKIQGKLRSVSRDKHMITMDDGEQILVPSNLQGKVPDKAGFERQVTVTYRTRQDGQKVMTGFFTDSDTSSGN